MIRRATVVAFGAGAAALAALCGFLAPAQLTSVALALGFAAALLVAVQLAVKARDAWRHARFARFLNDHLPDLPASAARLPWFVVLSASTRDPGPPRVGRDAIFIIFDPASPLWGELRRRRPLVPIAGAIIALPADRLLTQTSVQTAASCEAIANNLGSLREALAVRFPVTITITRAACLRGFDALARAAGPNSLLGWAPSAPLESPEDLSRAIEHLHDDARRARLHLLTMPTPDPLARAEDAFALPEKIASLDAPLNILSDALAPFLGARPRIFIRGIYLSADQKLPAPLLRDRLLPEQHLVCPQSRRAVPSASTGPVVAAAMLGPIFAIATGFILRAAAPSPRRAAAPTPAVAAIPDRSLGTRLLAGCSALRSGLINGPARLLPLTAAAHSALAQGAARSLADPAALAAHAESIAPGLPTLPTLPLTQPTTIPVRFHPAAMRSLAAEWRMLQTSLGPADREALAVAFSVYVDSYVSAWSAAAVPDVAPLPWPQWRNALAQLNPAQVNRQQRDLLRIVSEALEAIPDSLLEDPASLREEFASDLASLEIPWFDQACRRTRDKWASLPEKDPAAAVLRLTRARFQQDYLEVYAADPGNRYWSSLTLASLSAIADGARPRSPVAAFIEDTRAFPLCATSTRTLRPADLDAARDIASSLVRTGLSTSAVDESAPLSRGGRTDFPAINDQLARLQGQTAFDDARDQWAYRLRAVLNFLDQPQSCTLTLLEAPAQVPFDGATPATVLIPRLGIAVGDQPAQGPFFTDRPASLTFDLPGPDLTLTFRTDEGPVATIRLPEPWHVVSLLLRDGAVIDDKADPSGRLARVPIVFTDAQNRRWCYWVGLRFDRPPPALAQWPDDSDWPR